VELQALFEDAAERAKILPSQPREIQLQLYGLHRQATLGDVTGHRPDVFDSEARARYDAWTRRRGMSSLEAMRAYVDLVAKLAHSEERPPIPE
jgi:acyl-CoA-binding protein